jgi:hypothetical protein
VHANACPVLDEGAPETTISARRGCIGLDLRAYNHHHVKRLRCRAVRKPNMTDDPKAWRAITPEQLHPALNHIRESFGMGGWKCSTITKKLCYAQLHPEEIDSASVASYKVPFEAYRAIIGQKAAYRFDELLRIGSPPAIFRAYLDAYLSGKDGSRYF